MIKYKAQKWIMICAFLIVPVTLLIIFTYVPTISTFWYSLHEWNGISPKKFIWLDNYITIFTEPEYFKTLINSIYYFLGSLLQIMLGFIFAALLSFGLKFKNFFKGALFFPYLINGVAVGLIFVFFFRTDGLLNSGLGLFSDSFKDALWLERKYINNIMLASVSVWRYMGFNLVMFIGAIQSIPQDIYEAAEIDGANSFHIMIKIILPMIKNIIALNMILAVKGAVSVFEVPYIMTGGSFSTSTFVIETINLGLKNTRRQVGLASALSFVLFVIILVITLLQRLIFKEEKTI